MKSSNVTPISLSEDPCGEEQERIECDVLIIGAGPTGLMLANELGLAGVRTIVLEKLQTRSGQSKATSLQPRSAEILELRGLLDTLMDQALPHQPAGLHFAGLPVPLDCQSWSTRYPNPLVIPQARLEAFLEDHLLTYNVPILRGYTLREFEQDQDDVTTLASGPSGERTFHSRYLVGCDGAQSLVRKLTGIGFPGTPGQVFLTAADVVVRGFPKSRPRFPARFQGGRLIVLAPHDGEVFRLIFSEPKGQMHARETPVTEAEVREALHTAYGSDVELLELRWASRFSDVTRQVENYRLGQVFLAGDAAHVHLPLGGQGLNLGLQDAFNLGWKLAAQVQGWAANNLLDSYQNERHPVGARVLQNTRAQALLMDHDNPHILAFLNIFLELMELPDTNHYLAGLMSGLDIRYDIPGIPPSNFIGARMPDFQLDEALEKTWASQLLTTGRGLLLTDVTLPELEDLAAKWASRVDYIQMKLSKETGWQAALIRPDGYVCWVNLDTAVSDSSLSQLQEQLINWFGTIPNKEGREDSE